MRTYIYLEGFFRSKWLSKFINCFLFCGKQQHVESLIYMSFLYIKKHHNTRPLFIYFEALERIKPVLGLRVFQQKNRKLNRHLIVPYFLKESLRYKKAISWVVRSLKSQRCNILTNVKGLLDVLFNASLSVCLLKKKECYGHALLFKKTKKFRW